MILTCESGLGEYEDEFEDELRSRIAE